MWLSWLGNIVKGHGFDTQLGHVPGLQAWVYKWQPISVPHLHQCFSSSLCPSHLQSLRINKIFKK